MTFDQSGFDVRCEWGEIGSNVPSNRDCTLEAMRTQVGANQGVNCKVFLFAQASFN
jgi:hypothetical protein